jgi:hypothetical protein
MALLCDFVLLLACLVHLSDRSFAQRMTAQCLTLLLLDVSIDDRLMAHCATACLLTVVTWLLDVPPVGPHNDILIL